MGFPYKKRWDRRKSEEWTPSRCVTQALKGSFLAIFGVLFLVVGMIDFDGLRIWAKNDLWAIAVWFTMAIIAATLGIHEIRVANGHWVRRRAEKPAKLGSNHPVDELV